MKFKFGQQAKDIITGFEGTLTGQCAYISGCTQWLISPKVKDDGTLGNALWFDEQRITITNQDAIVLDNSETPGCDISAPVR